MSLHMRVLSGDGWFGGVKAWKQVPIVQLGVMRKVIRVKVSRAGPQLGLRRATEPAGEPLGQKVKKHNFQSWIPKKYHYLIF